MDLVAPLAIEDYVIQSMPDVSPAKWHLAHTSWFFETFVLREGVDNYKPFHPKYGYLFNSYYNAIGDRFARPERGHLSRPTVREVVEYREYVNEHIESFLQSDKADIDRFASVIELGINHEEQHQELIVTDIKHVLAQNPLTPVYSISKAGQNTLTSLKWTAFDEGLYEIGTDGPGFYFDNEGPRHKVFVESFALASRLVSNGEYLSFMQDGGYEKPELWLSDGLAYVQEHNIRAPLYWHFEEGEWWNFTLSGMRPVAPNEPVTHVSHYEADAYARWAGERLPTEFEWEVAANSVAIEGNFLESGRFHPAVGGTTPLSQMFGDTWQWTSSAYLPYPRYAPAEGALGEYNGKFMSGQMVLRGGSCATPREHIRPTYRNFFPPSARWQFSGIRLARTS
jgi:ergothioneine biosynthesis protein EgtB